MSDNGVGFESWTDVLNIRRSESIDVGKVIELNRSKLQTRDKRNKFTLSHAFLASTKTLDIETVKTFLICVKEEGLSHQLLQKSSCGQIPLQSAIRSGASGAIISLIATFEPSITVDMLTCRDNIKETPLETAFENHHWELVEVILNLCIENRILPELTGVNESLEPMRQANTLLCKAAKRGLFGYFSILFKTCKRNRITDITPLLCIPNKKNRTPWFYVVRASKPEIRNILENIKQFGIDINQLYINPKKATMLHEAIRVNDEELENILREYEMVDKQDISGILPCQQNRNIVNSPKLPHSEITLAIETSPSDLVMSSLTQSASHQPPAEVSDTETNQTADRSVTLGGGDAERTEDDNEPESSEISESVSEEDISSVISGDHRELVHTSSESLSEVESFDGQGLDTNKSVPDSHVAKDANHVVSNNLDDRPS